MQGKMKWLAGATLASGLLVGSLVASGVSAQTATPSGLAGHDFRPGYGMMGGGFGPGARVGAYGPGMHNESLPNALGITSHELRDARAAGKSVAQLAQDNNVDLTKVLAAALTAHTVHLDAAVSAGTLTQAQADAMTALMKSRIETQFQ